MEYEVSTFSGPLNQRMAVGVMEAGVELKVKWEDVGMERVRRVVELKMGMAKGATTLTNLKIPIPIPIPIPMISVLVFHTRSCSSYEV